MATEQDKIVDTQYNKIPLIFDVDDVILNSNETVMEVLNWVYELSPELKVENNKDWDYTYVRREIKRQKGIELYTQNILNVFELPEFWKRVKIRKEFLEILKNREIRANYKIIIVSSGTEKNLKMKKDFLYNRINMDEVMFLGLPLDLKQPNYDKKGINKILRIGNAIQIDDNYECLNTDARLKILLKNNRETTYNEVFDIREDLYVINDLSELKDILLFISNANNDFFKDRRTLIV